MAFAEPQVVIAQDPPDHAPAMAMAQCPLSGIGSYKNNLSPAALRGMHSTLPPPEFRLELLRFNCVRCLRIEQDGAAIKFAIRLNHDFLVQKPAATLFEVV